jgi:hypothetical protein
MYRKLRLYLSLDLKMMFMMVEALVFLAWGRLFKTIPFSKTAPSLGDHMAETPFDISVDRKQMHQVSQAVNVMSKYTFWESQCLVKAIAAMKMLERRGIGSTLYLGTAKDENGKLIAHAWLRSGRYFITGTVGMEKFTVVGTFAKDY